MAENTGKLTINQAVKAGWASRPTIYRAIKAGRLTVEQAAGGRKLIDIAELVRVFGEPRNRDDKPVTEVATARISEMAAEIEEMKRRLAVSETERDRLAQGATEASERERWLRAQIDRHTALLASYGPRRTVWGRVFGGGKKPEGQGD